MSHTDKEKRTGDHYKLNETDSFFLSNKRQKQYIFYILKLKQSAQVYIKKKKKNQNLMVQFQVCAQKEEMNSFFFTDGPPMWLLDSVT